MLVLVFDTETTGIIPENAVNFEDFPHIVQISFILYDSISKKMIECCDYIINCKNDFKIPIESTNVHGITEEISKTKGISIRKALQKFYDTVRKANYLVAHNLQFDDKMVQVEFMRLGLDGQMLMSEKNLNRLEKYCTMKHSRNLCKILTKSKKGKTYYKNPKQSELHEHLFGTTPENLHNSLNDILVCLRCFVKMKFTIDVCDHNKKIKNMIFSKLNV
jgi:DNA polymerase III epsilon subunit-like protein